MRAPPARPALQHDDAIMQDTYDAMTSVTNGQASLDGCPAVATMFTLVTGTGEWRPTEVADIMSWPLPGL